MDEALEDLQDFEDLPLEIKTKMQGANPEQAWYSKSLKYHAENRIRWKGYEYKSFYIDLIRYLRSKLEIFPYHLCRYLDFTSPFEYYIEMLCDLLRTSKPYDNLPTFTAADILRIIGIHRNSYSDLLQKCKEKGWVSKISRAIKGILPKSPLSIPVEGWWIVFPLLSKKGRKSALKAEVDCLHEIFKDFSNKSTNYAGKYDREALEGLYKANVIEFDIDIEGIQFEVVRDTKNFITNKSGFEEHLREILKLCENSKEIKKICELTDIRPEIVKDCLGILSRLGFLDVVTVTADDWHKSWRPLSDAEDSVASFMPSIEINNCDDPIKITLAVGGCSNPQTVKAVKDILGKFLCEIIESPNDAVALNSTGIDPIVFTKLSSNEAPLYRLFKLKYCRTSPVVYFVKGLVLTSIPSNLADYTFFLIHTDTVLKEIHKNELLDELSDTLPLFSVFLIPLTHRFQSKITIPLPLNTLAIKDRSLSKFLRDLNLFTHFEHFVGYIEIALLTDKNYLFLNHHHGIPLNSKELPLEIANSLIDAPWFKYNNLEVVAEAQQNEIFQYREFICDIDLDPGFILIT